MRSIRKSIYKLRSSTFFINAVICYAVFVDQLFFAFILPVLPFSLPERNGVAENKVQYWTTILIVVFGVACFASCPIIGWWTDRHASRRLPFLAGLAVLLASTLLMWPAKPMWAQILSRIGQGLADAMIYIVGLTIIIDTVTTKHVAEYVGYLAIALNVGTFAGPLLGGVVFDRAGYHAVWWMMLGFVILDAILRFVMLEKKHETDAILSLPHSETVSEQALPNPDVEQVIEESEGLPVKSRHSNIPLTDLSYTSTPPMFSSRGFSHKDAKWKLPSLITLLFSIRMDVALLGICVQSMIFSGFETVLSLYVQEIWHYSALGAGLIFIPLTLPAFFAPIIGRIVDRTTPRWAITLGFLGLCPILALTQLVKENNMGQKILMCTLLLLIGLGITMTLNPLTAEISYVVDELEKKEPDRYIKKDSHGGGAYAQAYALFAMSWSLGNIGGPLFCGLIKDQAGWSTMSWTLGLLSVVTAIPCFVWSGGTNPWLESLRTKVKARQFGGILS